MIGLEARIHLLQLHEAANHQAGADEQHEGNRHLRHHQKRRAGGGATGWR